MFLVFVSTSSMVIMASTITCRCWVDSDPEKQAMLMVLTGSPYGSPRVSTRREGEIPERKAGGHTWSHGEERNGHRGK